MKEIKIAIGSDHAGYNLKEKVKKYLIEKQIVFEDFGPFSEDRTDYPDFAHAVAVAIERKKADLGILICGSGNGINMAANKHQEIRSALCWREDIAEMARLHNDANIIALPARYIEESVALGCVDVFLKTEFEGGRHAFRVNKISCQE
ncbi:MAG: ribose 5-phosphate isomerase B [Flavobacteriales bacterium]|nr:MAG: ribose 5-phosphate isomerase B [Flavobacteriales bacterium]